MTFQDQLALDYGTAISLLTLRFGTQFELSSTGGGCYALTATLENGHLVMITDSNDASLNTLDETQGFGVGFYAETDEGNEQIAYFADPTCCVEELPDLVRYAFSEIYGL